MSRSGSPSLAPARLDNFIRLARPHSKLSQSLDSSFVLCLSVLARASQFPHAQVYLAAATMADECLNASFYDVFIVGAALRFTRCLSVQYASIGAKIANRNEKKQNE